MSGKLRKKYISEEAVKRALKINSFRNLSKDKVMQFVSMIPYMDKEVAIAIINQFPIFADFGKTVVLYYMQMGDNILKANHDSQILVIQGYQTILDALSKRMDAENITEEERKSITEQMILVADKMAEADWQNKKFLDRMGTKALLTVVSIVAIVAAALGISSSLGDNGELPELEDTDDKEDDSAGE